MLYEKILKDGKCTFTDTSALTRGQWLELRKSGIGGSDAGAIMGLNKYSSQLSVYLAKKGLASFDGNKATEWGNILEDPVRKKAREELGIEIESVPGMFTSKAYPFMNANLDGLVFADSERLLAGKEVSGLGGHEIKTSRNGDGFSDEEVPDSYYAQVQHYMAVTGLPFFVLSVFIISRYEGRHYVIPRNDEFIALLAEKEKDFWENYVMADVMPAPTGSESEAELVKSLPVGGDLVLDGGCAEILDRKSEIDAQIKELERQSDVLKEQLILRMSEAGGGEDAEKVSATCGAWKITYNTQTRRVVDSDALKKAGMYDQFTKPSVCRVLRISRGKGL